MNLLVDNQLPVALARYLGAHGWECIHVRDIGLDEASDPMISHQVRLDLKSAIYRYSFLGHTGETTSPRTPIRGLCPWVAAWIRPDNCRKPGWFSAKKLFGQMAVIHPTSCIDGKLSGMQHSRCSG